MDQTRLEKLKREVNEDDTKWEKIAELRRRLENHQFITWKTTAGSDCVFKKVSIKINQTFFISQMRRDSSVV